MSLLIEGITKDELLELIKKKEVEQPMTKEEIMEYLGVQKSKYYKIKSSLPTRNFEGLKRVFKSDLRKSFKPMNFKDN